MNENYIAYETLVANRAAAEWACWAMIASWVSAGATIVTLFLAFKALFTWREQEKTKVKIDFRNALKKLKTALLFMPVNIDPEQLNDEREQVIAKWLFKDVDLISQQIELGEENVKRFDEILSIFDCCQSSWFATEHLFDNTELEKVWHEFESNFNKYINGGESKDLLMKMLDKLISSRFVFESR